jgi:hypothetical protein
MDSHAAGSSSGGSGDGGAAPRRNSRKPKYSKFTQQELPACKPILTPKWVISVFVLVGVIFVPIGVASLRASRQVCLISYLLGLIMSLVILFMLVVFFAAGC